MLPAWVGEVFRFALGALLNLVVGYGSYLLLLLWLPYVAAYAIAYVIGIAVSYVFNALVVFKQPMRARAALSYPLVYLAQFLLGLVLLKVLILPVTFLLARLIVRFGQSTKT
jgi:putative flippase GtrA